ncbi:membrane protein insertase YidC [Saccharopolyspora sp. CA-218241]|uniref:membrane protein insertase YidC n=1 Tax=Saccharopolyspora sp. CA-218241 TaxID=3240027 RepID=UPI003D958A61
MLDFIYYPVSAILWFWHKVFGFLLDPASGYAWALSIIFLVFTLRALLFKPFVHQVRAMRKMQEFAPKIRELQAQHGDDREKLAREMQKLQLEQGFNPLGGCLPMLVQIPVLFGLFHVLNGFKPGAPSNFVFNADEVASFVAADLFGAKLSNHIVQPAEVLANFDTDRFHMLLVGIPLMIAAAIATHFTARHSVQRQTAEQADNPQAQMMNRMTLWIFPMFAIIGGPFLPLAILLYWLANNFWTLGQQRVVFGRIDQEEAAKQAESTTVVESTVVTAEREDSPAAEADPAQRTETPQQIDAAPATDSDAETPRTAPSERVEAAQDQPGETPGVIEDRSRDADKPGETR